MSNAPLNILRGWSDICIIIGLVSAAYLLLKDDIEKGDLNRQEMTAKLLCTLETAMHRAMKEKQYSAVASNAKVLMKLVGLEAKIKN